MAFPFGFFESDEITGSAPRRLMKLAVAGTDKMSADCAVGAMRTYAKIPDLGEFSYETWMSAVRAGRTFVTTGPLLDLNVNGKPMGDRIRTSVGTSQVWSCR
ncbi:hypothetical protein BQ8794_240312 [Mesorhizobium prunaredense]|uniref:Uncharacterized protein n=1 Tax=Mesorhizobium prunaredense TaxID=1631249 RepID=A0A1R3V888_9HYPH|nr:hypothetical protein BQ8794_240312 [Mesorhizobium prunaredense]